MFNQIAKILKDGITSLFYDIDGNKRPKAKIILFFVIIPIAFSLISLKVDKLYEIVDTLLTCLSIFTALIFTVLFIVPDKLTDRIKILKEKDDDATHDYLIRFYNFTKSFVKQISFVIVLSLALIILLIMQKLYTCDILTFINSSLFVTLIFYVLIILSNMYILLMDDIERNGNEIK